VASSFFATEKNFRRIMGWKDLWQLAAILGRKASENAAARLGGRVRCLQALLFNL
jgi:hypothetical protein